MKLDNYLYSAETAVDVIMKSTGLSRPQGLSILKIVAPAAEEELVGWDEIVNALALSSFGWQGKHLANERISSAYKAVLEEVDPRGFASAKFYATSWLPILWQIQQRYESALPLVRGARLRMRLAPELVLFSAQCEFDGTAINRVYLPLDIHRSDSKVIIDPSVNFGNPSTRHTKVATFLVSSRVGPIASKAVIVPAVADLGVKLEEALESLVFEYGSVQII